MKKKGLAIVAVVVAIASIIGFIYVGISIRHEEKELDKHLIELNATTLKEKMDNKDTFIFVITSSTCGHCAEYLPVLKEVLKENNIYGYYVENDKLDKDGTAYLNSIASINGTPTTIFIKNGSEYSTLNRLVGSASKSRIESRLESLGFIK